VKQVLENLRRPFCLATSSSPQRLAISMAESGLASFFENKSFTASQVQNGKPAPDLMLFAAENMAVPPQNCLVIEDSEMGLRAAAAAGMEAWRFMGGGHMKDGDPLPPDLRPQRVLDTMAALLNAFREIGIAEWPAK
jgi:beta-phosphoglucomutase-like phosphatase (HAD superfamily)